MSLRKLVILLVGLLAALGTLLAGFFLLSSKRSYVQATRPLQVFDLNVPVPPGRSTATASPDVYQPQRVWVQTAWSPDGRSLLLRDSDESGGTAAIFDLAGETLRIFSTDPPGILGAASWGPNGKVLVYRDTTTGMINLVGVTGQPYTFAQPGDFAVWSRDGTTLAIAGVSIPKDNYSDYTVKLGLFDVRSGQAKVNLWEAASSLPIELGGLTWSPDNRMLIFSLKLPGIDPQTSFDLFSLNLESGELIHFTNPGYDELAPAIAPNGQYVAFTRRNDTNEKTSVLLAPLDLSCEVTVAEGLYPIYSPTWSPKSDYLAMIVFGQVYALHMAGVETLGCVGK